MVQCMKRDAVYAFVGVPEQKTMCSRLVEGTDAEIECVIDDMMDLVDCQRKFHGIWMVIDAQTASFEDAASKFTKYMQFKCNQADGSENAGVKHV